MVYHSVAELDFRIGHLPTLPAPGRVLMTTPDHYQVLYVINPHMQGQKGTVDPFRARAQWEAIREAYLGLGLPVEVIEGEEGLPDMVFCANQSLPFLTDEGERRVVLSHMHAPQRRPEVRFFGQFFEHRGYTVHPLPHEVGDFEGMGDALWHPGRGLLWAGYGFRTDRQALHHVSRLTRRPVVALELTDPDFYHLDTCLSLLDERTALVFPGAFTDEGLALIERLIERIVYVDEHEARSLFACNAHCPDGRHVFIQTGCTNSMDLLRVLGFEPRPLDTDEFLKGGASVFCMKLMIW